MPPVAAPAAVIGVMAAVWYSITLGFGLNALPAGRFAAGFGFGLGVFLLLAACHNAPVAAVFAPPWRRSVFVGAVYAIAFWFVGASAFGPAAGWLMAAAGGTTAILADRRTSVDKRIRDLYRWLLAIILLGSLGELLIAWIIDEHAFAGLGTIAAVLLAAVSPIGNFPKWTSRLVAPLPSLPLQPALTQNLTSFRGYQAEALAFCAFMAPNDIPRSLVIKVALEVGQGKAPTLNKLAASAFNEAGPDSLNLDPLTQQFAFQRLAVGERKTWAKRAVRTLAAQFPIDYATNLSWCERLAPHALAAAQRASDLDVERGASALLLNHVAGFLILTGRPEEASQVLAQALDFATAAFGRSSPEAATVHANLAEITEQLDDPARASNGLATFTNTDSSALALDFARLGDVRRDQGDVSGARQNYYAALGHAKSALGGHHSLVTDLRGRLAALPPESSERVHERRLLVGGLTMIVVAVAVFAGVILWRDARVNQPKPSSHPLGGVEDLRELCAERKRFFPEAAPFTGQAPHPIQLFVRSPNDSAYRLEQLADTGGLIPQYWQSSDSTVHSVQLVGCVTHRQTGDEIAVCKFAGQRDLPLHQAVYVAEVVEARTGRVVGSKTLAATQASCPAQFAPPPMGKPWQLYAAPSFQLYATELGPFVEQDAAQYARGHGQDPDPA